MKTLEEKKLAKAKSNKKYREANKEKIAVQSKAYYKENKETILAQSKAYNKANKEKLKDYNKVWGLRNRDKCSAKLAKYRATKFGATIYMTNEDKAKIAELYTIAKDTSKLFGYNWEVDHIVPLSKGGLHKLSNLQVVPKSWNRAKSDTNSDVYWS